MKSQTRLQYALLLLMLAALSVPFAHAEDVPIPPKRPKVMSVSPAFLEQLKNREKPAPEKIKIHHVQVEPQGKKISLNDIEPAAGSEAPKSVAMLPLPPSAYPQGEELANMVSLDHQGVLEAIDKTARKNSTSANVKPKVAKAQKAVYKAPENVVPIPRYKPEFIKAQHSAPTQEEDTLVSFMLQPGQIRLDDDLKMFLQDHALRLFNEKDNLMMEIQAYASPTDNEKHSDVRVALARALEVRSFLLGHNISPSRLKLTPKGKDPSGTAEDRIDLIFIENP